MTGSPAAPRCTAILGPRQEGEIRKRIETPTTAETTNLNSCDAIRHVPEIKLIRTDTTLDLSQKAEKVCSVGRPCSNKLKQVDKKLQVPRIFFYTKIWD